MRLEVGALVNAAGLAASRVARAIEGLAPGAVPETLYAKGNYFGARRPRAVPPSDLSRAAQRMGSACI